jgi:integrase
MAMVRLKGLHTVKVKGREYHYAWRGGPRIDAELGTPEFHAQWAELHNPLASADRSRFGTWVALYEASDEYKALALTTKHSWSRWFPIIKEHFGKLSVRQFDRPAIRLDIKRWRAKWKHSPRSADYGKQVLSRILSFAVAEGKLTTNMCEGIPNLYENNRADIIWTADDIERLCASASPEIGYACRLGALTGLRQGDCLKLAWSHIEANAIELRTSKSGGRRTATVPLYDDLRVLLKAIPRRSTRVLTTTEGRPWQTGFASSWKTAMARAGLKESGLHFHDLRGTAATNFFRAGFTIREIAITLGWAEQKIERMIERYVKRDEVLRDRIRRMESFTSDGIS